MRMRPLLAIAVLLAAVGVAGGNSTVTFAAPAGCQDGPAGFPVKCEQVSTAVGPRGTIGLLGDSVMLGSNDGMSNPGLPTLLRAAGWGPIRMTTSLGMRTRNDSTPGVSAYHVLGVWKAAGFNPSTIVVNLGANHIQDCTPTTVALCHDRIHALMTRIATLYPTATVWWSKTLHETYGKGTGFSPGMLGWNAALDREARERSNLVVWDWPRAVATSNPKINMDRYNVHPVSGLEYVKRSRLILADLLLRLPAHYRGPRATLPAVTGAAVGLEYTPAHPATRVYSTLPANVARLAVGTPRVIDLSASPSIPAAASALALTVTASGSTAAGTVRVYACGAPTTSPTLRFGAAQRTSAQAVVRLPSTKRLCAVATTGVDLDVWTQGSFAAPSPTGQTLTVLATPSRLVVARTTVPSSGQADLTLALPLAADGAAANVTIVSPTAKGTATLHQCDQSAPAAFHVSFNAGTTTSAAVYVPTDAPTSTHVCARVRMPPGASFALQLDVSGLFRTNETGARFRPATTVKRLLDTVPATPLGGWWGRLVPAHTLDVPVAPAGAVAATFDVTMTAPLTTGRITAYACGAARPSTVAVAANSKATALSGTTSKVSSLGRVCLASSANTGVTLDLAGWWVTTV